MNRCACCGFVFAPKSMKSASSLQGGENKELCIECSDKEETLIEAVGDNSLPELLSTYIFDKLPES